MTDSAERGTGELQVTAGAFPPEPSQSLSRNTRIGVASAIAGSLGILLVMAIPHLRGETYTWDDLGTFHYPLRAFYAACLEKGHHFDWMPTMFAGFFVSGEGQLGAYHPFHWLLYRWLPLRSAFHLELLSSYPFMLAGMYFWLRRVVHRADAAWFGAMVFTFSGFNMLHFIHPNAVAIVAHIPWLLLAVHSSIVDVGGRRLAAEAGLALLTASQLLLGYPQYVWFSLLAETAWAAFLIRAQGRSYVRLGFLTVIGVLIGAIQLLPTWELLQESERVRAGLEVLMAGSWAPSNLVQLAAPYLLAARSLGGNTHEFGLYIGAAPLLLVFWVLFQYRCQGPRRALLDGLGLFLLVALLLACGQYGGLAILQTYVPFVGRFRVPARALVLVHLGCAVLAALAFAELRHGVGKEERRRIARVGRDLVAFSVAIVVAIPVLLSLRSGSQHLGTWPWILAGPLLIGAAAGLCRLLAQGSTWAVPALVLFTGADLGFYGVTYAVFPNFPNIGAFTAYRVDVSQTQGRYLRRPVLPPGPAGERLVALPKTFGGPQGAGVGDFFAGEGFCQVDGYAGLEPPNRLFGQVASVPALRAAGVRWVFAGAVPPETKPLVAASPSWWEVPQPVARVRLVTRTVVSVEPSRDIQTIDPQTTALVDAPVPVKGDVPGTAQVATEQPGDVVIRTEASSPQLLVLADRFHSGWTVQVDKDAAKVLRVNGTFLGCVVPAGRHTVQWEFRPASLRWGRRCAVLGVCLLGIFLAMRLRPGTRRGFLESDGTSGPGAGGRALDARRGGIPPAGPGATTGGNPAAQ